MDRRLHKATGRVAHLSMAGQTDLPLSEGEQMAICLPLVDLLRAPGGARERQLALGEAFCALDRDQGHVFGFALKDGYCGWLREGDLGAAGLATHWVASPGTHLYDGPKVQSRVRAELPMGARLAVIGQSGDWAETRLGYVPRGHMLALDQFHADPVAVAAKFLHTPYLWGGNSRAGLDCSGLVQMVHHACNIEMAGDSDLQEQAGAEIAPDAPLLRGDLLFWRGHVALVVDAARLIHANGHSMSVAYEDIAACTARIAAAGGGPVTHRRRI